MTRPCFLVIDREFAGSISTRKLVIETAKLNVITAYSGAEAVDTLRRFPAVSGIVLDADVRDLACVELVAKLKSMAPTMPIVVIGTARMGVCEGADYHLDSFDPSMILELLKKLEPEQTAAILEHDQALAEKQ